MRRSYTAILLGMLFFGQNGCLNAGNKDTDTSTTLYQNEYILRKGNDIFIRNFVGMAKEAAKGKNYLHADALLRQAERQSKLYGSGLPKEYLSLRKQIDEMLELVPKPQEPAATKMPERIIKI